MIYFLGGILLGIGLSLPIWYKVGKLYHECVELEEELDRKGIKY